MEPETAEKIRIALTKLESEAPKERRSGIFALIQTRQSSEPIINAPLSVLIETLDDEDSDM